MYYISLTQNDSAGSKIIGQIDSIENLGKMLLGKFEDCVFLNNVELDNLHSSNFSFQKYLIQYSNKIIIVDKIKNISTGIIYNSYNVELKVLFEFSLILDASDENFLSPILIKSSKTIEQLNIDNFPKDNRTAIINYDNNDILPLFENFILKKKMDNILIITTSDKFNFYFFNFPNGIILDSFNEEIVRDFYTDSQNGLIIFDFFPKDTEHYMNLLNKINNNHTNKKTFFIFDIETISNFSNNCNFVNDIFYCKKNNDNFEKILEKLLNVQVKKVEDNFNTNNVHLAFNKKNNILEITSF